MMGRSHAVSGAAAWAGACAGVEALGGHPRTSTLIIGAGVCAGFALVPDLDHPQSLIARTFGWPSQYAAKWLAHGCRAVHDRTRTPLDWRCRTGHRTLTHTTVFAVAVGAVVSLACWLGDRWALGSVVFIAAGLALRGLLSARERHKAGPFWIALASMVAAVACVWLPGAGSWWWLGIPAAVGCLTHSLGDSLTIQGAPLLWPLVWRGRRWHMVATPQLLRIRTGSGVEAALAGLFAFGGLAAGFATIAGLA